MKVVFQNVDIENVVKGKSRYSKAVVTYSYNGEPRRQTIMSFSNPTVFKQIQELEAGATIDVELIKNEAGFSEWKSINIGDIPVDSNAGKAAPAATKVVGSNYESREERASRQVLIVKQSSLNAAVATLAPGAKAALNPDDVKALAQSYADWVFDNQHVTDDVVN